MDYIKVLKLDNTHRVTMYWYSGYYWIQLEQYYPDAMDAWPDGWRNVVCEATTVLETAATIFDEQINNYRRIEAKPAIIYYNFKEINA